MNTKTLGQLCDALLDWKKSAEKVGVSEFDMALWVHHEYKAPEATSCGTACCAGGLAALLGIGGLSHDARNDIHHSATGTGNWGAIRAVFGLTREDAYSIFLSSRYDSRRSTTPAMVAERIDSLLKSAKGG